MWPCHNPNMAQDPARRRRLAGGLITTVLGIAGLISSFIATLATLQGVRDGASVPLLLDAPIAAIGLGLFTAVLVVGMATLARPQPATAPSSGKHAPSLAVGILTFVLGVIGWWAAFALTADKVVTLREPGAELGCNVSLLVQCGANLESWQGSVFGFPNPLIGLVGWSAVLVVAVLVMARVTLSAWFWVTFNVGAAAALAFVIWLISQSIFVLGTLCPWCMVTWAVTIPLFWMITLGNARRGHFGESAQRTLGAAYAWTPLITMVSYLVVAIIAQLRLDVLLYL